MTDASTTGWHVARITFEAVSPLSCGAGAGERADNALARDASGLPYVPGPTLQGLLRAFYHGNSEDSENLFGPSSPTKKHRAARLMVSHAHVHDRHDRAVSFPAAIDGDPLLRLLALDEPLVRDHVKLDHRHAAEDGAKIERAAVPRGARFSFELMLHATKQQGAMLDAVISAMAQPDFRVGSSGARGYGKIKVTSAKRGFFDSCDFGRLRKLRGAALSEDPERALRENCLVNPTPRCLAISFALAPQNPWRSGQNGVPGKASKDDKAADLRPTREGCIVKDQASGELSWRPPTCDNDEGYILAGSALRGPLVHRSLYCWNKQHEEFLVDDSSVDDLRRLLANRVQLESLTGKVDDEGGLSSSMLVDDILVTLCNHVETPVLQVTHVKIGAHSGGAYSSALYDEELLETERLVCSIYVRRPESIDPAVRIAFLAALHDLLNGKLALGAKSYGFCVGHDLSFEYVDKETWRNCWLSLKAVGVELQAEGEHR